VFLAEARHPRSGLLSVNESRATPQATKAFVVGELIFADALTRTGCEHSGDPDQPFQAISAVIIEAP
jgi:hypothetical protein